MTQYVEILSESRGFSLNQTSSEQTIVIQFKLPVDDITDDWELPSFPLAEFMGATDDVLALEIAYSILPQGRWIPGYSGNDIFMVLDSIKLDEQSAQGWWKASATYIFNSNTGQGGARPDAIGAWTLPFIKIGFNVGNRTKTMTQSLELVSTDGVIGPQNRPDPCVDLAGNVIGQSEDGINGAEVPASGLVLQITAYYFPEYVTFNFLKYLADAFPSYNADEFLTFPIGTCAMLGADGQATVTDVIPITYTVDVKPNIEDQPDPPFPNLTCLGQDLVEYLYVKEYDECAVRMVHAPIHRKIHRVLKSSLFANLGFPTS